MSNSSPGALGVQQEGSSGNVRGKAKGILCDSYRSGLTRVREKVREFLRKPAHGLYLLLFLASLWTSFEVVTIVFYGGFRCTPPIAILLSTVMVIFLVSWFVHIFFIYNALIDLEDTADNESTWKGTNSELAIRWLGICALLYIAGKFVKPSPLPVILSNVGLFSMGLLWSLGAYRKDRGGSFNADYVWSDSLAWIFWLVLLLLWCVSGREPYATERQILTTAICLLVATYFYLVVWKREKEQGGKLLPVLSVTFTIGLAVAAHKVPMLSDIFVPKGTLCTNGDAFCNNKPRYPSPDHLLQQK